MLSETCYRASWLYFSFFLSFFFSLELTFVCFFPMAEGTPSSKCPESCLGNSVIGNTLYFILSLLWSKIFSEAFGWPSFSLSPLNEVVGQRQLSSLVLCSAVLWVPSEVTDTAASPSVHRPFEVTSKGLFTKGLQVQGGQIWPIPSLLFNGSNIISFEQTEAFFYIVDTDPLA